MKNNLFDVENALRAMAKRYKNVKYSLGLAIAFLMSGTVAFSEENINTVGNENILTRSSIGNSVSNLRDRFKNLRKENDKSLDGARLELTKLMEQGDQVIKSPWSSWQVGTNFYYDNWKKSYKGKGDKAEKYPYEGVFVRDPWWIASLTENSKNYSGLIRSSSLTSATTTQRGNDGDTTYGFFSRNKIKENPVEMKLQAGIKPRTISFEPLNLEEPSVEQGANLNIPNIDIPTFSPQEPKLESPTVVEAPILTFRPKGFGQQWHPAYFPNPKYSILFGYSNILVQNFASYDTEGLLEINDTEGFRGTFKFKDINEENYQVEKDPSYSFSNAFISDTHDGDVEINGNYKFNFSDTYSSKYFVSLNPYEVRKRREFKFLGNLEINSKITNDTGAAIAFEHQLLSYGPGGNSYGSPGNNSGSESDPHKPDAQSVLINEGNIKLASGRNMVGIVIDTEGTQFLTQAATINRGKIEIGENASESIGIDFGSYYENYFPYDKVYLGNIIVKGKKSYGFRLQPQNNPSYYEKAQVYGGDDLGNKRKIEVYGEENIGASISQNINSTPTTTDKNAIEEMHGLDILVGGKKNTGFLRRNDYVDSQTNDIILNDSTVNNITFDEEAEQGVLVRSDKFKITSEKNIEAKAKGDNNIIYLANGKDATIENRRNITIKKSGGIDNDQIKMVGMMGIDGAKLIGTGSKIESDEVHSIGVAGIGANGATDKTNVTLTNSTISITAPKSVAIYNEHSKSTVTNSTINTSGYNSISVYNKSAEQLEVTGSHINASNGAIAFYPTKYTDNVDASNKYSDLSVINLSNTTTNIKDGGLFFYSYTNTPGHEKEILGKLKIKDGNKVEIGKEGVAFYNKGNISTIESYLNFLEGDGGTKNLGITLKDGARLFVLDDPSSIFNLSSLPNGSGRTTIRNAAGTVNIDVSVDDGAKYKYYTANGGTLNIDTDVNLNDTNDNYFKNDIMSASVNVLKPITNNGENIANGTKYAIAQKNSDPTNINRVTVSIDNSITLTSKEGLTGVVVDGGKITNNNTVSITGDNAIGLLGANKTEITNNKDIIIGNKGVGILGLNKLAPTSTEGGFKITQASNSTIKTNVESAEDVFGVVALNNENGGTTYTSDVTLENNSKIDFSNTIGGIGVTLRGTKINFVDNGSIIKVGKNGRGILIDDRSTAISDAFTLALNGGEIEAIGDGAMGIYSAKDLTSSKIIKVGGKKSVGYYAKGDLILSPGANLTVKDSVGENDDRTIGIFAKKSVNLQSDLTIGKNSIGILKKESSVIDNIDLSANSKIDVKNGGIGVYGEKSNFTINPSTKLNIGDDKAIGIYAKKGSVVNNNSTNITIGESSFGFVTEDSTYNGGNETISLNKDSSVFLYAKNSTVSNVGRISGTGNKTVGIYGVNSDITANNDIDLSSGKGNIGIYGEGSGKTLTSTGNITVGESLLDSEDETNSFYSIGIVGSNGIKINSNAGGNITLKGNNSIGIYATGAGTEVENYKDIIFNPNGKVDRMVGLFVNDGAKAINYGNISTASNYSGNADVKGLVGIAVTTGTLENHGNISINADESFGMVVNNAVIKNYGNITINGTNSIGALYDTATEGATGLKKTDDYNTGGGSIQATGAGSADYKGNYNPDKTIPTSDNTEIKLEDDKLVVKRNGKIVSDTLVNLAVSKNNLWFSNVGIYIDTLGKTNPIQGTGFNSTGKNDLIIGAEAASLTNNRNVRIGKNIMQRFIDWQKTNTNSSFGIYSGSLTWIASYDAKEGEAVMTKIDYKNYADKSQNEYNFLDGLEQRYDMNNIDSKEKMLFNKLNNIQKNEGILFTQAVDEMMGHQYANVQQRVYSTGSILDKEFNYLRKEWSNPSKNSNKIKTFGMRGEYNTDTAGVIDYTNNAYGVTYVHETEDIKLGKSVGWYAGIVHNKFKFKDIGNSKEEMLKGKLGVFKSIPFDNNNSLNLTVSGEIFAGYNKMNRRFLVVDEIFQAKSKYYDYGLAGKAELGKEFRLSENFSLKPYGSIKTEYGRVSDIKEKSGEIKLEVKSNDYISLKPEIGTELVYKHLLENRKTFTLGLGVSYDNELGRVANGRNKAKVADTSADWFNIRGEKEDRRGNIRTDLKLGLDNSRLGITANIGYDTKGHNIRGGAGIRVIF
ncbi:autotransporter-associated N-terminal domain-containing protein [Fusobacterium massiliense]|uniref:autotransporter-associated N-terminal domain-containing protein n=1 Tax=Fusobacterium massiliense TaxID=1852365 RepID=UPI0028E9C770|nr:autotransporter-associated N-terminal domain-containing protein [Fusobacterium massiliense]